MKPHTMKKLKCCKKRAEKQVKPESNKDAPQQDNSVSAKLNRLIQGSLNGYYVLVNLLLFVMLLIVHMF